MEMICMEGFVIWVVVIMWLMVWLFSRFLGLVIRCSGVDVLGMFVCFVCGWWVVGGGVMY